VIEGVIAYRESALTGEALHRSRFNFALKSEVQEETRGQAKRCKVADDPVVVRKSRPEKPGNRVEEKTGKTVSSDLTGPI
jgi:hypothetical protein